MHKFCASGFFCLLDFVGKTNKMMPIDRERSDADMNSLKRTKLAYSILSIVLIVIGIYLIMRPQTAMLTVCISKWWLILILAVIAGALGAMLLVIPLKVVEFVMVLIGINLVIDGVLNFWVVHDTVRMIDSL